MFFASFDVTRRCGLRVKALFGGQSDPTWSNIMTITPNTPSSSSAPESYKPSSASSSSSLDPSSTPTRARVAQATTIVAGGVTASILADVVSRPFRICQRLMTELPDSQSMTGRRNPVLEVYKTQGISPFFRKSGLEAPVTQNVERGVGSLVRRFGWRLAAVGPWGAGFLVWAWVGGEV